MRVSRISLMMMVCLIAFCMLSYHMMRLSRFIVDCRRSTTAHNTPLLCELYRSLYDLQRAAPSIKASDDPPCMAA